MTHPSAIVIREEPLGDGPTRRRVYTPRSDGRFELSIELWRCSIDGWHTTGEEVIDDLAIDAPGMEAIV